MLPRTYVLILRCLFLFIAIACSPPNTVPATTQAPTTAPLVSATHTATPTATPSSTPIPPTATPTPTATPDPPTVTPIATRVPPTRVPPTATFTPRPTPTPDKYPVPKGKAGLIVQNFYGRPLNFTIADKEYQVPANSEMFIVLEPGTYTYSANISGIGQADGTLKLEPNSLTTQPFGAR